MLILFDTFIIKCLLSLLITIDFFKQKKFEFMLFLGIYCTYTLQITSITDQLYYSRSKKMSKLTLFSVSNHVVYFVLPRVFLSTNIKWFWWKKIIYIIIFHVCFTYLICASLLFGSFSESSVTYTRIYASIEFLSQLNCDAPITYITMDDEENDARYKAADNLSRRVMKTNQHIKYLRTMCIFNILHWISFENREYTRRLINRDSWH